MKVPLLRLLAAVLVVVGLGLAGLASRKTVTLTIDAQEHHYDTMALTTGGFLRMQEVKLAPGDKLTPDQDHWLRTGDVIQLERAARIAVYADGSTHTLLSAERIPAFLLAQSGVTLSAGDRVLSEGIPISPEEPLPASRAQALHVQRAVTVSLRESSPEGEQTHVFTSTAVTLGQALWEEGIRLYTADRLSLSPNTLLRADKPGSQVEATLERSREITVRVGETRHRTRSAATTIGEAVAGIGLSLQGLDYTRPPEDSPLPADGRIRLVRVEERVIIEETPLPFETEYQAAPEVEIDQQAILKTGEYGLTARRVRVRYEDGREISRQVEGEWTARKPQNRVVGYGTKVVMHTLKTPDGTIRYWRAVRMWATSYSPNSAGGETTASGQKLRKGLAAIDRNLIPFGTMMYVPGYGMAEAADTGAIRGRWIDLGYSNSDYKPWHEWVTVYFLWPPPANPVWIFP